MRDPEKDSLKMAKRREMLLKAAKGRRSSVLGKNTKVNVIC